MFRQLPASLPLLGFLIFSHAFDGPDYLESYYLRWMVTLAIDD